MSYVPYKLYHLKLLSNTNSTVYLLCHIINILLPKFVVKVDLKLHAGLVNLKGGNKFESDNVGHVFIVSLLVYVQRI